jgi:hypothetical protein
MSRKSCAISVPTLATFSYQWFMGRDFGVKVQTVKHTDTSVAEDYAAK